MISLDILIFRLESLFFYPVCQSPWTTVRFRLIILYSQSRKELPEIFVSLETCRSKSINLL